MQDVKEENNYKDFKERVLKEIENRVDGRVEIQKITKNNGLELDGLTVLEEGINVSPTIYLNYYYDRFLEQGMDVVVSDILLKYKKYKSNVSIDISFFSDTEKVRDKIKMKLVNYERNKELLKKVPYVEFLDLAILFYVEVETRADEVATILINNNHMKFWEFTIEDMFKLAETNMKNNFIIKSMSDILCDLMSEEYTEFEQEINVEMYILTNCMKMQGAIGMLRKDILNGFMEKCHTKQLVIIPSSIHEVLLIPCDSEKDISSYNEMVQEVNATQLQTEEVLSDNAYIYDGSEIKIIE